jgi:hypothetical protein
VYSQVHMLIDTLELVSYVVSGGCPSATMLASASARSLPREWLCASILPRCVRMHEVHRVCGVWMIYSRILLWMLCRQAAGQRMKPWIRRSEHALSVRRWVWPSWRPTSMPPLTRRG